MRNKILVTTLLVSIVAVGYILSLAATDKSMLITSKGEFLIADGSVSVDQSDFIIFWPLNFTAEQTKKMSPEEQTRQANLMLENLFRHRGGKEYKDVAMNCSGSLDLSLQVETIAIVPIAGYAFRVCRNDKMTQIISLVRNITH